MTHDVEALTRYIQICLVVASICSTAFPVLYAFSPWFSSRLGRALMLQSAAFALAMDLTVLFQFWAPKNILVDFWIEAIILTLIAIASAWLTGRLWAINHKLRHTEEGQNHGRRSTDR